MPACRTPIVAIANSRLETPNGHETGLRRNRHAAATASWSLANLADVTSCSSSRLQELLTSSSGGVQGVVHGLRNSPDIIPLNVSSSSTGLAHMAASGISPRNVRSLWVSCLLLWQPRRSSISALGLVKGYSIPNPSSS